MDPLSITLGLAAILLAIACATWLGARFGANLVSQTRLSLPDEVMERLTSIERRMVALEEDVQGQLDRVERKRRSLAGSASKLEAAAAANAAMAAPERTPEQRRADILRGRSH